MALSVQDKKETQAGRTGRLGLRTTPQQQLLIQRAAKALNKSVTEFILDSACKAAEDTLMGQRFFLLDDESWKKFQEVLDRPAEVNPKLQQLMKEKAPWE